MDRRQTYVRVVWGFTLFGLAVVAIVFFDAAFPDNPENAPASVVINISDFAIGEPKIFELSATRPLIILRADRQQLDSLAALELHVWEQDVDARMLSSRIFVHWAFSTGKFGGCRLKHVPPVKRPVAETQGAVGWLGGYWGSGCDASYDYAGRAIKSPQYSYGDYVGRSQSLHAPNMTVLDKDRISINLE